MISFHKTRCPICNTENKATQIYPENFDLEALTPDTFSARRLPDQIHYRIVKCNNCKLVRSDPVMQIEILNQLYSDSSFNYDDQIDNLKFTYGKYLAKINSSKKDKGSLLEIGCGNGFFLEEAIRSGYSDVRGVEPSKIAIGKANERLRKHIICDIMRPGLFHPGSFDLVCMFQVLDHVPDPCSLIKECWNVLKPGGSILIINHNIDAISSKMLKEKSPIIDIEHTYLFSPKTISKLLKDCNFSVKKQGLVYNRYSIPYLLKLLPLNKMMKQTLLSLFNNFLRYISLSVPLGNMYLIAQKGKKYE